jgi:molecular chaperone Hsp33
VNEVQRFVFEGVGIRGALVRLDETWRNVRAQHDYPHEIERLLGESVAATVLLATGLKGTPAISMQLEGNGPVKLLLTQCTGELRVRGLAHWRADRTGPLLGGGKLAVNLEGNEPGRWFQGIVPLVSHDLNECLESYFQRSEQLPTRLVLAGGDERVAGLMLQHLPGNEFDSEAFNALGAVAATVGENELNEEPAERLLPRLFAERTIRLFRARAVLHDCRCTAQYLARVVRMLGREELDGLIAEQGRIEVTCEFCNRSFRYERDDVDAVLRGEAPDFAMH